MRTTFKGCYKNPAWDNQMLGERPQPVSSTCFAEPSTEEPVPSGPGAVGSRCAGWLRGASAEWRPQVREYIQPPVKLAVSGQALLSPEFQGTDKGPCSLLGASKSIFTSWLWKN